MFFCERKPLGCAMPEVSEIHFLKSVSVSEEKGQGPLSLGMHMIT